MVFVVMLASFGLDNSPVIVFTAVILWEENDCFFIFVFVRGKIRSWMRKESLKFSAQATAEQR
jgi:hypothetical protein